ncbi:hypothetical protein RRM51_004091 [Aeromonas veronii]|nr:hypothetical protein [Aeromonas veronii]
MKLFIITALAIIPQLSSATQLPSIELHAVYPFEPVTNNLGFPYIFHITNPMSADAPLNIDKLQFRFKTEDAAWPSYCQTSTGFSSETIRGKRDIHPKIRNIDDNKGQHIFNIGSHIAMPEEAKMLHPGETIDVEFLSDAPLGNGNTVGGKICMDNIEKSIDITLLP